MLLVYKNVYTAGEDEIMEGIVFFFDWEVAFMEWIQGFMGDVGRIIAEVFTQFGGEIVLVMLFGVLFWCIDKEAAVTIGTNFLFVMVANPMIKGVVMRRRPYFDNPGIQCLSKVNKGAPLYDVAAQGFSFPSAHASNSAAVYGSLISLWKNKTVRIILIILPIIVGISRVALGVHYPTDVMAGWVVGTAVVLFVSFLQSKFKNKNLLRVIILIISLTGFFYCETEDYFTCVGVMMGFVIAVPFEEKFVRFKETKKPLYIIIRVACGMALVAGLSVVLKLPFSKEFLGNGSFSAHLIRTLRYAIIMFVMFAVYPMSFRLLKERS